LALNLAVDVKFTSNFDVRLNLGDMANKSKTLVPTSYSFEEKTSNKVPIILTSNSGLPAIE